MKSSSSSPSDQNSPQFQWKPLTPGNFPSAVSSEDDIRYAKDDEYLQAVLGSWEEQIGSTDSSSEGVETSPWIYYDDDGNPLFGHVVRPIASGDDEEKGDKNSTTDRASGDRSLLRSGILLFHTAAGPQDVFLFQKAAALASSDLGCVVLICDVLSDRDGWAWNSVRTQFNEVRGELFADGARLLRSRVEAAVRVFVDGGGLGVDPSRLASLGWCFGAQPILELAALQDKQDRESDGFAFSASALISYHGVYRRDSSIRVEEGRTESRTRDGSLEREVLICTGKSDPFVSRDDLEFAEATMGAQKYTVKILEFEGAKHGFTNPAQDFNPSPSFEYNEDAATKSWEATMELLKQKLL